MVASEMPIPDPTILTTEALTRAIAAQRDYIDSQFDVVRERLRGIDKATEVLNQTVTKVPTDLQKASDRITELASVKFESIDKQLVALSERTVEQKADVKAAVDAALQAAKEAVGQQTEASERSITKSEVPTTKQIDSLGVLLVNNTSSIDDKMQDLKSRLDRLEGNSRGIAS
jgi:predicted nuclease with TOPRIM domain